MVHISSALYVYCKNGGIQLYDVLGLHIPDADDLHNLFQFMGDMGTKLANMKMIKILGLAGTVYQVFNNAKSCINAFVSVISQPDCFKDAEQRGEWRGALRHEIRDGISGCVTTIATILSTLGSGMLAAVVSFAADVVVSEILDRFLSDSAIDSLFDLDPGPPVKCDCTA